MSPGGNTFLRTQAKQVTPVTRPLLTNYTGTEPLQCTYTGNGYLTIKSRDGKSTYYFSSLNRVLSVMPPDVSMMQKFKDLLFEV